MVRGLTDVKIGDDTAADAILRYYGCAQSAEAQAQQAAQQGGAPTA